MDVDVCCKRAYLQHRVMKRFARMQYVVTGLIGGTDRRWTGQRARQLNNPGLEHPMHTLIKGGRD